MKPMSLTLAPLLLMVGCNAAMMESKSNTRTGDPNALRGSGGETSSGTSEDSTMGLNGPTQCLWPPNHKMVEVKLEAVDAEKFKECVVKAIKSNEPVDAAGGSKDAKLEDFQIPQDQKIPRAMLRAERDGAEKGRIYEIMLECRDQAGEAVEQKHQVIVPHDMSKDQACRPEKTVDADKDVGKEVEELKQQKEDIMRRNDERKEEQAANHDVPEKDAAGDDGVDQAFDHALADVDTAYVVKLKEIEDRISELENLMRSNEEDLKLFAP